MIWSAGPIRTALRVILLLVVITPLVTVTVTASVAAMFAPAPIPVPKVESRTPALERDPLVVTRAAETRAVEELDRISERTHVAVSVRDERTGDTFHHGSGRFRTASLVKVHFSALMLWRADRTGVPLTDAQRLDVTQMLIRSENDPANRAYFALGGPPGIERGLDDAFGRAGIRIGEAVQWGSSTTRPRDIVKLLGRVLATDRETATTYALLQDSMRRVIPDQRFGITELADPGTRFQVKVGWVQAPTGWVVNSSGRSVVDGSPVLVSIMSDRHATREAGIEVVDDVARAVGDVVRARRMTAEAADLGADVTDRIGARRRP